MSKSTPIRPLHGRIVVKAKSESTTAGGIVIPDTAGEKPEQGEVIAVGPGKYIDGKVQPLDVKVGDRVLFGKYAGTSFKLEDTSYLVMNEDDVMGVLV